MHQTGSKKKSYIKVLVSGNDVCAIQHRANMNCFIFHHKNTKHTFFSSQCINKISHYNCMTTLSDKRSDHTMKNKQMKQNNTLSPTPQKKKKISDRANST
jgi:hypothetical protein